MQEYVLYLVENNSRLLDVCNPNSTEYRKKRYTYWDRGKVIKTTVQKYKEIKRKKERNSLYKLVVFFLFLLILSAIDQKVSKE